jgi:hypothetical protein
MQITPVDRKILLVAGSVFLVIVGAALLLVRGADSSEDVPTVYSPASGGCKAAFLLLRESGYQVQTWERPLHDLPVADGKGKTLIIVAPSAFPALEEKQKLEAFLRSGGRLIAAGQYASFFLQMNQSVPDPLSGTNWRRVSALSLSPITQAAPEITLAPQAYWRPGSAAVSLYGNSEKPVVIEYKIGQGSVLWLAAATPLTNAGLTEVGNLEFLLSAVGGREKTTVLWDEYIHGYERSGATGKSSHLIAWIGLQFGVFALAILLAYSRRSGPVWVPEREARLSPLEFVRTLGLLYEHANAGGVAVEICFQRFRYLLTRRLGVAVNSSMDELARATRERHALPDHALPDKDFFNILSECESCRYDTRVPASKALRLVQALFDFATRLKLMPTQHREKKEWKQS